MKHLHWVLLLFPLMSLCSDGPKQRGYTLKIFQYEGTDSLQRTLAVTRVFNAQNQLLFEQYHQKYEENGYGYFGGSTTRFIYRDTCLVKTIGAMRGDSLKSYSLYNDKGQLIKSRSFQYQKKLKPSVDKGLTRPGGCIILPEDYEKNRVWQEGVTSVNRYNAEGKRVEYTSMQGSTVLDKRRWSYYKSGKLREQSSSSDIAASISRTCYFYDDRGRLSKQVSYRDEKVSATNNYSYRNNSVYVNGTYAAFPGQYPLSVYRNVKKLDLKGRLIEETDYVGRCTLETKKRIRYRPDGRIAQTVLFTCRDSSRLVHDYVYTSR
ncbi:hypothetical protein Q5H92_11155 [Hymenobacter sp. M29]|uniref:YD repeat-containing protein n=1 Tax=Hymenobacter mellowenesis TaxID=3063995 RepID=A0ABT9ABY4_9BACT|nr:hypothetical protein [Hymenobacter sp. M29]MDO7846917.1 hypothetical protein [Hymenobacter sp. M29]